MEQSRFLLRRIYLWSKQLSDYLIMWAACLLLASQKMMGLVKQDKVIISVVTPIHGAGNGYAATFMGRFFTDNGEVILSGAFRLSTSTRLFISVYFLCSLVCLLV